jgi:hypothetical protein
MNTDKIKLFAIALFAVALGTQSCSEATEYVRVEAIGLTPDNTIMLVNTTTTLVAEAFPMGATDKGVIWTSDNLSVATVDGNGLVSALSEGTATITATAVGNEKREKTCTVTVISALSISLNVNSLRIPMETTHTLTAAIVPDNLTQEVIWTSDNTAVVTVDGGVVTTVAPGTAKITATSVISDDRTAECVVTVVDVSSMPAGKWIAGMWTFEDADNPGRSTIGADLEISGDITLIRGPGNTGAVKPAPNAYYTVRHNIGANGGGDRVNEYTLMMDIRGTASEFAAWLSVFNTQSDNTGEGVLWIDGNGLIGYARLGGYSSPGLTPDTWYRVVITAKLGESFRIYIDGEHVFTASGSINADGLMSLHPEVVYIGADGTGYAGPAFADVRMWSVQLTDDQVRTLGKP